MTERIGNGCLDEYIRRRSLLNSPTLLSKLIAGLVLGMRFMQDRKFVHGHLTRTNILLNGKWLVRITLLVYIDSEVSGIEIRIGI